MLSATYNATSLLQDFASISTVGWGVGSLQSPPALSDYKVVPALVPTFGGHVNAGFPWALGVSNC